MYFNSKNYIQKSSQKMHEITPLLFNYGKYEGKIHSARIIMETASF